MLKGGRTAGELKVALENWHLTLHRSGRHLYTTTLTNLSMNYLVTCKVYTDVGGTKELHHVCSPVRGDNLLA